MGCAIGRAGSARFSRYNCRDAVWWWLQAVQEYVKLSPEGADFLQALVVRFFPTDDVPDPTADTEAYATIGAVVSQCHARNVCVWSGPSRRSVGVLAI